MPAADRSIVHVDLAASVTNNDHEDDDDEAGKTVFTIPLNILLSLSLYRWCGRRVGQKIIMLILHEGISLLSSAVYYILSHPGLGLSIFCQRVSASPPRPVSC